MNLLKPDKRNFKWTIFYILQDDYIIYIMFFFLLLLLSSRLSSSLALWRDMIHVYPCKIHRCICSSWYVASSALWALSKVGLSMQRKQRQPRHPPSEFVAPFTLQDLCHFAFGSELGTTSARPVRLCKIQDWATAESAHSVEICSLVTVEMLLQRCRL